MLSTGDVNMILVLKSMDLLLEFTGFSFNCNAMCDTFALQLDAITQIVSQ